MEALAQRSAHERFAVWLPFAAMFHRTCHGEVQVARIHAVTLTVGHAEPRTRDVKRAGHIVQLGLISADAKGRSHKEGHEDEHATKKVTKTVLRVCVTLLPPARRIACFKTRDGPAVTEKRSAYRKAEPVL